MAAARLDKVMPEFEGRLNLKWRAFPLEIINDRPAPRHIVDQEWPLIAVQEPLSPCRSWPHDEYLRTTLRAYQAYASAYAQDPEKARVYDLNIRRGFFCEGRRVDEDAVLCEMAEEAGLDASRVRADLESGAYEEGVMDDYREAMRLRDEEGMPMTSPTLIFPSGEAVYNPYASDKTIEGGKLTEVHAPPAYGEAVYAGYREILARAAG